VDENGDQPPSIRSLKFLLPTYGFDEETRKKVPDWFIPDWKLPWSIMANGALPLSLLLRIYIRFFILRHSFELEK